MLQPLFRTSLALTLGLAALVVGSTAHASDLELCLDNKDLSACIAACDAGEGEVCHKAGVLHIFTETPDWDAALSALEKGCEVEFAKACWELGKMYREDSKSDNPVISPDAEASRAYFERAHTLATAQCEASSGDACMLLGKMYDKGQGVDPDDAKASEFFAQACELGVEKACDR